MSGIAGLWIQISSFALFSDIPSDSASMQDIVKLYDLSSV